MPISKTLNVENKYVEVDKMTDLVSDIETMILSKKQEKTLATLMRRV